jgi:cytochrome c-type biogenesis protein CcmH/NrfG
MRKFTLFAVWLFTVGGAAAQSEYLTKIVKVHGQLKGLDPSACISAVIQLSRSDRPVLPLAANVNSDCTFETPGIPAGLYAASVVLMPGGDSIHTTFIDARESVFPADISVPKAPRAARPISGLISVRRLSKPPSKRALKLFHEAHRLSARGSAEVAVAKLRAAIALDPEFSEAHGNLGAEYARLHRWEDAISEFRIARSTGLETAPLYANLAFVLLASKQAREAESAANHALSLDPSYAGAHYVLAHALLSTKSDPKQILNHLAVAALQIPSASLLSAQLYANMGDTQAAGEKLREYARAAPKQERVKTRKWITAIQDQLKKIQRSAYR